MLGLFFDTSYSTSLAIFNEKDCWVDTYFDRDTKGSNSIQKKINDILKKNSLEISEITQFVFVAGPGSYTGLRVSHGIAQLIKEENKKISSFYHYLIPSYLGLKGPFFSKAFKGDYFFYNGTLESEIFFLKESEVIAFLSSLDENMPIYTHYKEGLDAPILEKFHPRIIETSQLLYENPSLIKKIVAKNEFLPLYYYRNIEQEFKKPNS